MVATPYKEKAGKKTAMSETWQNLNRLKHATADVPNNPLTTNYQSTSYSLDHFLEYEVFVFKTTHMHSLFPNVVI